VQSGPRSCRRSSSGSASMTSRRSPPRRGERTRRSAAEATRRWRVHPTVSAHTGEGLGRRLGLALSAAAHRPLVSLAAARERERGGTKNEARVCARPASAVLFGRESCAAVGFRWTAHTHRTEFQPRRDETFPAQAQVAAWSVGRTERERAAGLFSVSGRMAAWDGERGLRASGSRTVFGFGPLRVLAREVSSARTGRGPISFLGIIY
jgi:hypothetical protein